MIIPPSENAPSCARTQLTEGRDTVGTAVCMVEWLRRDPLRTRAQQGPQREPPLDASSHEAVQRIGPQTMSLAHFELGPRDHPPGRDVLPAVGPFVSMKAPGALLVGGAANPAFICADMRVPWSGSAHKPRAAACSGARNPKSP